MTFETLPPCIDTRRIIVGDGVIASAGEVFSELFSGHRAVIIADPVTWNIAGDRVAGSLGLSQICQSEPFVITDPSLSADWKFVELLEDFLRSTDAVPVAVGSGVINDLTKLASYHLGRPYVCVPTVASSDGYAAFGASIIKDGAKQTFECSAPYVILMDTGIIFNAPRHLTAGGYADLMAKITAGADWIVADAAGAEKLDEAAFGMSQNELKNIVLGFDITSEESVGLMADGLLQSGVAMQMYKSSRPASGTEHLFCHLWDVQHRRLDLPNVSHGFQVGIGLLVTTAFYEMLLSTPVEKMDMAECAGRWPSWSEVEREVSSLFKEDGEMMEACLAQTRAKYVTSDRLLGQLSGFQASWGLTRDRLSAQLLSFQTACGLLEKAGAPTSPQQIGVSRQRLMESCRMLPYMRNRFTVVDLAVRLGLFENWLDALFSEGGIWSVR